MTPQLQLEVASASELQFPLPSPATPLHQTISSLYGSDPLLETITPKSPRTIRVALAGCGVVGGGLVRLLHDSASSIASRFGVRFVITTVLVRDATRDRRLPLDSSLFTNDLDAFLANEADIVVEAIGGDEPARTIAKTALRRGKKLITANKELIATYGDTLAELATDNGTSLDFGAAVGGSAPVISTLRDLLGASAPLSVRGILNGTSNYVISQLESGLSLDAALACARDRGLAEADSIRDLDGRDAADKLSIIGWIAFGIRPSELKIRRISLLPGIEQVVRLAAKRGGHVRLISECTRLADGRVASCVEPVIVPSFSAFARTTLEENRVEVDLGWTSPLSVSGPGAGGAPTAAALLSDLVRTSPPANERGAAATQFVSVADPRKHRWLIAARIQTGTLRAVAENAGLQIASELRDGEFAGVVTRTCDWNRVRRVIQELERAGACPCVARYELGQAEEVLT
jgi:homoserine dehydrogenase